RVFLGSGPASGTGCSPGRDMSPSVRKATAKAPRVVFACSQCGEDRPRWFGRCPGCDAWNSAVERRAEEVAPSKPGRAGTWIQGAEGEPAVPRPLADVA